MSGETLPPLPESGYRLIKIYTTHLEASVAAPADPSSGSESKFYFGRDWRQISDRRFDVALQIKIDPSGTRPERAVVHAVGEFETVGEPEISTEDFATRHAVVMLFPYVRQLLTTVTASSPHGAFYLPAVNVGNLVQRTKAARSVEQKPQRTERKSGAKRLAARKPPPLATRKG